MFNCVTSSNLYVIFQSKWTFITSFGYVTFLDYSAYFFLYFKTTKNSELDAPCFSKLTYICTYTVYIYQLHVWIKLESCTFCLLAIITKHDLQSNELVLRQLICFNGKILFLFLSFLIDSSSLRMKAFWHFQSRNSRLNNFKMMRTIPTCKYPIFPDVYFGFIMFSWHYIYIYIFCDLVFNTDMDTFHNYFLKGVDLDM